MRCSDDLLNLELCLSFCPMPEALNLADGLKLFFRGTPSHKKNNYKKFHFSYF